MNAVVSAFFERQQWHLSMGCASFNFVPEQDIINVPGHTDGGVHKRGHQLVKGYQRTHSRVLVMLDQQFGGEMPAAQIRTEILQDLHDSGWDPAYCEAVVIDPELEVWLWQDNPNVEQALKFPNGSLRQHLESTNDWPNGQLKPDKPKEVMQGLMKMYRAGTPMVVYRKIARSVGLRGCQDGSFGHFRMALQTWFPL